MDICATRYFHLYNRIQEERIFKREQEDSGPKLKISSRSLTQMMPFLDDAIDSEVLERKKRKRAKLGARGVRMKNSTPEDDQVLVDLQEIKSLTWKQIAEFVPGQSSSTLQARYYTKLEEQDHSRQRR